jgi:hypothetical protein
MIRIYLALRAAKSDGSIFWFWFRIQAPVIWTVLMYHIVFRTSYIMMKLCNPCNVADISFTFSVLCMIRPKRLTADRASFKDIIHYILVTKPLFFWALVPHFKRN